MSHVSPIFSVKSGSAASSEQRLGEDALGRQISEQLRQMEQRDSVSGGSSSDQYGN